MHIQLLHRPANRSRANPSVHPVHNRVVTQGQEWSGREYKKIGTLFSKAALHPAPKLTPNGCVCGSGEETEQRHGAIYVEDAAMLCETRHDLLLIRPMFIPNQPRNADDR